MARSFQLIIESTPITDNKNREVSRQIRMRTRAAIRPYGKAKLVDLTFLQICARKQAIWLFSAVDDISVLSLFDNI